MWPNYNFFLFRDLYQERKIQIAKITCYRTSCIYGLNPVGPVTVNLTLFFSLNIDQQEQVIMDEYNKGWAVRAEQEPDDEIIRSGVSPDNIRKWKVTN